MRAFLRHAPLCALFWSELARGQSPPSPAPPPPPRVAPLAPAPPPPPPVSGPETPVRSPDMLPPAPPIDQGPDTLPSLDEDEPEVAPKKAPAKKRANAAAPAKPAGPIRADRRLALLGELGWNGLAGFGAIVSLHANPHLSFDLGAGLAAVGGKLGLRVRYNVSERRLTPIIGVGIMGATGFDAPTRELAADDNEELNIELKPSAFLQTVVGLDWTAKSGFTLLSTVGYAFMLTPDNVVIITGEPTPDERKGLDIAFRSGIVISIAMGYSFR
ncbi:MAG TPA: hypothetical protein VMG12_37765 [Polyangiaceae bacterium]|nr:hypothetical protein [Polyangiaceae bacterium]